MEHHADITRDKHLSNATLFSRVCGIQRSHIVSHHFTHSIALLH